MADLSRLTGLWEGSLTYLDYTSGEPYTMGANVDIKRIGGTNRLLLSVSYPEEASANSTETLTLSADGTHIDDETVISRAEAKNGDILIVTEKTGTDGNDDRPAVFRFTYIIGRSTFSKKKEVRFDGETEWVTRHEYSYTRTE